MTHFQQHNRPPVARLDTAIAVAIGAALAVVYACLIQFNTTYDGAFFVKYALAPNEYFYAAHMIWGPWLRWALAAGGALGLDPRVSGSLQAGLAMAAAMGLLYAAMRRCGAGRGWSALFTLLMALNGTTIENATSIELYGLSLAAVLLSLHAFLSEARRPTRGGAGWLLAANVFVVWAHVGFAFWVLSQYVALALAERKVRRGVLRFAQGFGVLAALFGALWASQGIGLKVYGAYDFMYGKFYQPQSILAHAGHFLLAPATWFQAFAGLAIFPAVTGWLLERRRVPALALHGALVSLLFFGFYHAWNVDLGTFYLPVMVVWTIFAALGTQAVFRSGDGRVQGSLGLGALLTVALLVLPYKGHREGIFWIYGHPSFVLSGLCFYALAVAQWRVAGRLTAPRASGGAGRRRAALAWGAATLAATLFCYLPRHLWLLQPDEYHDYIEAVRQLTRGGDARLARLIATNQTDRLELETGVVSCSFVAIGTKASEGTGYDQNPVSEWIREMGRPTQPLRVWMDASALPTARIFWGRGILEDIPLAALEFRPVTVGRHDFVEIRFKDPAEARRYWRRLDPYPVEDWGGQPVMWTRPSYEEKIARGGRWLEVKYHVGHKKIGRRRPVRVEMSIDGAVVYAARHRRKKTVTARLKVPESAGKEITLAIKVTPGWRAREGRDLGVGLYPLKWP